MSLRHGVNSSAALLDVLRGLLHANDAENLVAQGLERIAMTLNATHAKIMQTYLDDSRGTLRARFWHGYSAESDFWSSERQAGCDVSVASFEEQEKFSRSERSLVGNVLATSNLMVIEDVASSSYSEFNLDLGESAASELLAPIKCELSNTRIAVCLSNPGVGHFVEEEKTFYEEFFELLALLIDRQIRQDQQFEETKFQKALQDAKPNVDASSDFTPILEPLVKRSYAVAAGLFFFSPDDRFVVRMGGAGAFHTLPTPKGTWFRVGNSLVANKVLRSSVHQRTILAPNSLVFPIRSPTEHSADLGGGKPLGFLVLRHKENGSFKEGLAAVDPGFYVLEAIRDLVVRRHSNAVGQLGDATREITAVDLSATENIVSILESAPEKMRYSGIHVWIQKDDRLHLVAPKALATKEISVSPKEKCLVCEVFNNGIPKAAYGIGTTEAPLLYPEIVPDGAQSWFGYPIASRLADQELSGVISCFDRSPAGENGSLISKLDVPVVDAFATVLHLTLELQNALERKVGRQSIRSHEITILVSLVQANVDILYKRLEKPERTLPQILNSSGMQYQPRSSQVIYESVRTVILTLQGVLTRERMLSGEWKPNCKSYSLHRLITNSVAMIRTLLRRRSWVKEKVEILYEEIERDIVTDAAAFQEILFNVLMNAAKYATAPRFVFISEAPNGDLLVGNHGIGVPLGEEEAIFELGFQGSNASRAHVEFDGPGEEYRDKGIGLHVCREGMRQLGGDVVLEHRGSARSNTVFRIILPRGV